MLCMHDYTISIMVWHLHTCSSLFLYAQGHSNSYLHACIHTVPHCSHNHTHTVLPRYCIMMMLLWSPNKIIHASFFFMHLSFAVFLYFPSWLKSVFVRGLLVLMFTCYHIYILSRFSWRFLACANNVDKVHVEC